MGFSHKPGINRASAISGGISRYIRGGGVGGLPPFYSYHSVMNCPGESDICAARTRCLGKCCFPLTYLQGANISIHVSVNGGTPNLHPKMMIFSRKTNGCWVPPF